MPTTSHSIQPIPIVAEYFGSQDAPIVRQEFTPGRGWVRQSYNKRISGAWARKLRSQGVTSVALELNGRLADFRIEELVREDRRPLFTGNIIGSAVKL